MAAITQFDLRAIAAYLLNPADVARVRAVCRDWRRWIPEPTPSGETLAEILAAPYDKLLNAAIKYNSIELAKIALGKMLPCHINMNFFDDACYYGYDDIATLIVARYQDIARVFYYPHVNYNGFFCCATSYARINLARELIEQGANAFNEALILACRRKSFEGAKFALSVGATNIDEAIIEAIQSDFLQFAEVLLQKIRDIYVLNRALRAACFNMLRANRDSTFARTLIERGADAYDDALYISGRSDKTIEFTRFLLSLGAIPGEWDWINDNPETIKLLLDNGLIMSENLCTEAISSRDIAITTLLISYGAAIHLAAIMERIHAMNEPEDFEYMNAVIHALIENRQTNCPICNNALSHHF